MHHAPTGAEMVTPGFAKHFAELPSSGHLGLLYDEIEAVIAPAAQLLALGLARGERAVFLSGELPTAPIVDALTAAGVDVPRERERGAFELRPSEGAPPIPNRAGPETVAAALVGGVVGASASGFSGLRLVVDMSWLIGSGLDPLRWGEAEAGWTELSTDRPLLLICAYNRGKLAPAILREAFRTHPMMILDALVCPNPYYEPRDVFLDPNAGARHIAWMADRVRRARRAEAAPDPPARDQYAAAEGHALATLAATVESFDDAIIGVSPSGSIVSWNRGAERLYRYPPDEIIGRPLSILVAPERRAMLSLVLGRLARGVRVSPYQTVHLRKDGARVEVSLSAGPIRGPTGPVVGAVAIVRDISERKALERQRAELMAAAAQAAERERIALGLHDGVIQSLFASALVLARAERLPPEEVDQMRAALARARGQLDQAIRDVRDYIQGLSRQPPGDGDAGRVYRVPSGGPLRSVAGRRPRRRPIAAAQVDPDPPSVDQR